MFRAMRYCVEEAAASLWRARRSGALSIITNAAALFVLGALLLVTGNIERLISRWATAAEMSVYLSDELTAGDRTAIETLLRDSPIVQSVVYRSKAEALDHFRQEFSDLSGVVGAMDDSPLPASFEIQLQPDLEQGDAIDALAAQVGQRAGVDDVRYDRRWIERVAAAVLMVRGLGTIVVAILIVAAGLTVANVVRLAGHTRRDELEIMRLVGAPWAYVRGPFVVEGIVQGGAGAGLALVLLWVAFVVGRAQYGPMVADLLSVSAVTFLPWQSCGWLVLGGMSVGCLAGVVGGRSAGSSGMAPVTEPMRR